MTQITIVNSALRKVELVVTNPQVSVRLVISNKETKEQAEAYILREQCVKLCAHLMSHYNIRCDEIAEAMNIPNRCTDTIG